MTKLEKELEELLVGEFGFSNHLIKNIKEKNYTADQIGYLIQKKYIDKKIAGMHPKAREKARLLIYGNAGKHTFNTVEA